MTYEEIRERCIKEFSRCYKDSIVFNLCKIDEETRVKLLNDKEYIRETGVEKAKLFIKQIETLDTIINNELSSDKPNQNSMLKAIEMKNELLLKAEIEDVEQQEKINFVFTDERGKVYEKEDDDREYGLQHHKGDGSTIGNDFGSSDDNDDSFEAKMKRDVATKIKGRQNGTN